MSKTPLLDSGSFPPRIVQKVGLPARCIPGPAQFGFSFVQLSQVEIGLAHKPRGPYPLPNFNHLFEMSFRLFAYEKKFSYKKVHVPRQYLNTTCPERTRIEQRNISSDFTKMFSNSLSNFQFSFIVTLSSVPFDFS